MKSLSVLHSDDMHFGDPREMSAEDIDFFGLDKTMERPKLPDLPTFCRGPFRACHLTGKIFGVSEYGGECLVADIRGWGYLTGKGQALALDGEAAIAAQEKTAEFIAQAMNDALERYNSEKENG